MLNNPTEENNKTMFLLAFLYGKLFKYPKRRVCMASEKNLNLKKETVKEIVEKIKSSESVILFTYQGLTVESISGLRKELRTSGGEVKIYKNTLAKRAFEELNIDFTEYMNGPNAIMFGKDILDSIKALSNFAKQNDKLEIRIGIISGDVATLDTIKAYAAIPSRDGLLTMFASGLIQYVKEFAIGLNMIAEQKEEK